MKPELFDFAETEPARGKPGGQTWFFQGADNMTIQYSEIWDPESSLHTHEAEQINIVLEGCGHFRCGDTVYELTKGCIIRVPPNIPHGLDKKVGDETFKVIQLIAPKSAGPKQSERVANLGHMNWD